VKKGRRPGIYPTWPQAQQQVQGFKGAIFKGFLDLKSAQNFMQDNAASSTNATASAAILLYTDGGTRNTGNFAGGHVKTSDKAAWAYLIQTHTHKYQASAGQRGATNNQMELTAVLKGLQKLHQLHYEQQAIVLVADSRYVLDALRQGWLQNWQRRGWKKANGQPVLNQALWQQIYQELQVFQHLEYRWTKGHAQDINNNFVDQLLNQTMDRM
ncbi:reverse transcriptase-like protein, partial [Lactobacillus sp. XV13L]|nr:reverse transcriptase-like protein [Lactobacillus sp. XV13L]